MRRSRPLLILCALALGACSVRSAHELDLSHTEPDQGEVGQIQELSRRFSAAYVAGDIETMVSIYTPDAVIFPGNSEAIRGHDAIRRYWALAPGQRVTLHRATPAEIRIDGGHAYDHGVYEIAGENNGTAWGPSHGKYVIVWRRTPRGWRMHLDMWNSRPQPARRAASTTKGEARGLALHSSSTRNRLVSHRVNRGSRVVSTAPPHLWIDEGSAGPARENSVDSADSV